MTRPPVRIALAGLLVFSATQHHEHDGPRALPDHGPHVEPADPGPPIDAAVSLASPMVVAAVSRPEIVGGATDALGGNLTIQEVEGWRFVVGDLIDFSLDGARLNDRSTADRLVVTVNSASGLRAALFAVSPSVVTVKVVEPASRSLGALTISNLHYRIDPRAPVGTPETRGLLSDERIGRMKPGAYLVNVARAPLIDERAVVEALRSGRLAGAAIDVFPSEPLPADSPFLTAPGVILTPHFAWHSTSAELRTRHQTIDGVLAYLEGSIPADGRMAVLPSAV